MIERFNNPQQRQSTKTKWIRRIKVNEKIELRIDRLFTEVEKNCNLREKAWQGEGDTRYLIDKIAEEK